ncbi:T9SS C-terminal target domain-containing protein [bacterium]|nr:MAG: T9SS C-terminal target domain-containing protein [bacterium]
MRQGAKMKKFSLLLIMALFAITINVFAQGTWSIQTIPTQGDLNSIWAVNDNICWACGPSYPTGGAANVIKTTNGGTTWTVAKGNLPNATDLYTICGVDANICWVGAGDGGLYVTTDGGTTWTFKTLPAPATAFVDVVHFFSAQIGFVLGDPAAAQWCYYWTTNGGTNWTFGPTAPAPGTEAGWNNSYAAIDSAHIWFGTNNSKIYKGSFRGGWTSATTSQTNSFGVAFNSFLVGNAIMTTSANATTANQTSANGGTTWTATSFTPPTVAFGIKAIPNTNYAWLCTGGSATSAGSIYRTTNSGTAWATQTTGLASGKSFYCISMYSVNRGWAGTGTAVTGGTNGGVFKYTDNIVGIGNTNTITPSEYALNQNYPNPFNPTTTINYSIPKASFVTLKVYDVLGHEVMTVVNEYQQANNYSHTVNFSNLSSGLYYYTLKADGFTTTKKLMLVK